MKVITVKLKNHNLNFIYASSKHVQSYTARWTVIGRLR